MGLELRLEEANRLKGDHVLLRLGTLAVSVAPEKRHARKLSARGKTTLGNWFKQLTSNIRVLFLKTAASVDCSASLTGNAPPHLLFCCSTPPQTTSPPPTCCLTPPRKQQATPPLVVRPPQPPNNKLPLPFSKGYAKVNSRCGLITMRPCPKGFSHATLGKKSNWQLGPKETWDANHQRFRALILPRSGHHAALWKA